MLGHEKLAALRTILMNYIVIRQTILVRLIVALLCLAFLLGVLLMLVSIIGQQAGIMLIAPPYYFT